MVNADFFGHLSLGHTPTLQPIPEGVGAVVEVWRANHHGQDSRAYVYRCQVVVSHNVEAHSTVFRLPCLRQ